MRRRSKLRKGPYDDGEAYNEDDCGYGNDKCSDKEGARA
jgi:hypothetical protein